MSNICTIFVVQSKRNNTMNNSAYKPKQYEVGCSGSGWGVWNINTNEKVESCGDRLQALELMYNLNGWRRPTSLK